MKEAFRNKLSDLQSDFTRVYGTPFSHFYCPILFKDEDVELCKAHIINQAFPNSSRTWSIQRKDVDNFYGSKFESDFVDIREFDNPSLVDILKDKSLSKKFNAKVTIDGKEVEHFFSKSGVPNEFPLLKFAGVEPSVPMGLKMQTSDLASLEGKNWEVEISRDIRLASIVSVIKAAHLTLFELLGYNYVRRASADFVGRQILGNFFLENLHEPKREAVLMSAQTYFREFVHMARPLIADNGFQGTITDSKMLMCMGSSGLPWATIVFVKTSSIVHGVMIPTLGDDAQAATFFDFLKNDNSSIRVSSSQFSGDKWEVAKGTMPLIWPKAVAFSSPL